MGWVLFFCIFPGENKTIFEAFYMSLITLTTVGLGAVTPLTEDGMIFCAFFMIIGSALTVNVIGKFCEFVAMMSEYERFSPEVKKGAVNDLKGVIKQCGDKVTEMDFFRFIIRYQDLMTEERIDSIRAVFARLNPQGGVVDFQTIVTAMEVDRELSVFSDKRTPLTTPRQHRRPSWRGPE